MGGLVLLLGLLLGVIVLSLVLGLALGWVLNLLSCWWEIQTRFRQTRRFFHQFLAGQSYAANPVAWSTWYFTAQWDQPLPPGHRCFSASVWETCARLWVLLHSGTWTRHKAQQVLLPDLRWLLKDYGAPDSSSVWGIHPVWVVLERMCRMPAVMEVIPWDVLAGLAYQTFVKVRVSCPWYSSDLPLRCFWRRRWLRCRRLARRYAWSRL